jgi:hypothetical protein
MQVAENSYWSNNGKHQADLDRLQALVPARGEAVACSPVEFIRLAVNAYYDLYNNGFINAEIKLTPLVEAFPLMQSVGALSSEGDDAKAVDAMEEYLSEYMDAENGPAHWGDGFDESEDDEDCEMPIDYPNDSAAEWPMEHLMDTLVAWASRFPDPAKSVIKDPAASSDPGPSM